MKVKIRDLFGVAVPDTAVVSTQPAEQMTPAIVEYVFDMMHLRKLLLWVSGQTPFRNLVLIGGMGVGKTSLILQFAARMGIEVFSISCSGKTRFADLVGTLVILKDGSTQFVDGPLTRAYRNGGIFLANEITRMDVGEQMRFVDVLDSHSRLTITQTGEILTAHPNFRFAATGNSGGHGDESGAYAGEKIGSMAFMDRFLKLELEGLSETDEISLVAKIFGDTETAKNLVTFARSVRKAFAGVGGACRIDMSPRATIMLARVALEYKSSPGIKYPLKEAFTDVILNGSPKEDREAVDKMYTHFYKMD